MRSMLYLAVVLVGAIGCAVAADTPGSGKQDAPLSVSSSVDEVLDALDARGQSLKDFTCGLRVTEVDNAIGLSNVRTGNLRFQKLDDGEARIRMTLDQKEANGKTRPEKLEYVYSKGWLVDRDYQRRLNIRRQVVRPGEKLNLLKLGEGPFPLPLGQKKEDVHQLFQVTKGELGKDDPARTVHLQLTPKKGTKYEKQFDAIDFWVDPAAVM